MKIAIDGIAMSHPQPGGYRTYTTNLVHHLARVDGSNRYLLLTDRPIPWSAPTTWDIEVIRRRCDGLGFVWREQAAVPTAATRQEANMLHSPCATGPLRVSIPLVVTIHDVIEFSQPLPSVRNVKRWAMRVYSRLVQERLATIADRVITVSQSSKRQILKRFGLPPQHVVVIHEAPSAAYRKMDRRLAKQQSARLHAVRDHVLAFASAAPRKNVDRLIAAYAHLGDRLRERHPLALICTHPALHARLAARAEQLKIGENVTLIDRPSDEDLLLLYNSASVFVFPSLEEGFGLPPLEAMACGTPVVASDTSSLPEVLGDAAILVPPKDLAAIADAIGRVLTTASLAEELQQRGLQRSRMFSWERTARETLAVYSEVVGRAG